VAVAGERPREQRRHHPGALDLRRPLADLRQRLVEALGQLAVQAGRPAPDGGHEHRHPGPHHPAGLTQRPHPVLAAGQVVERAQQEHGVDRGVAEVELAGVTHRGADPVEAAGGGPELLDMEGDQVAVLDPVAAPASQRA